MNFKIIFKTSHEKLGLFDNFQEADGLSLVDLVKEETGLIVPPDTIRKQCNLRLRATNHEPSIEGKYADEIMKHPSFKHFSEITVIVPAGWFGQFVYEKVTIDKHHTFRDANGYGPNIIQKLMWWWKYEYKGHEKPYNRIMVVNEFHRQQIIDEWFEAGMPNYWGLDEERHTEMVMREIACEEERQRVAAEQARIKAEELKRKRTVDLQYFADELELMSSKLKNIQEIYNK